MTYNSPLPPRPRPLGQLADAAPRRVLTARALHEHGVSAATADERCRPGGPWQLLLPGVYLLHAGPPTSEERLRGVLLYAGREAVPGPREPGEGPDRPPAGGDATGPDTSVRDPAVRGAACRDTAARDAVGEAVMLTGPAALALHGFTSAPPLPALDRIDVLVPHGLRLPSTGYVRVLHDQARALPRPEHVAGLPVAPVPRALADAVGGQADAVTVRRLLTEAVRDGRCEAHTVVRELTAAKLLGRPHVVDAVDALLAEGRALAEGRLHAMVLQHGLPDPCWNVDLCLPGGPRLGGVDAYWPGHAVAVELDTRAPRHRAGDPAFSEYARKREVLEGLGITVVHLTPKKLRTDLAQQAAIVRTALMTAAERLPAEHVVVLPR